MVKIMRAVGRHVVWLFLLLSAFGSGCGLAGVLSSLLGFESSGSIRIGDVEATSSNPEQLPFVAVISGWVFLLSIVGLYFANHRFREVEAAPVRFSLRELMVVTTIVAVILGLIVWLNA